MKKQEIPQMLVGAAVVLILVTGLIHFADAPDNFTEVAYKGVLFVANGFAALAAAWGIYRQERWGWLLGTLVAGGAFVMYIVSRTIGLPIIGVDDAWFEPMGVVALLVEGAFIALAFTSVLRYNLLESQSSMLPQPR